MLRWWFVLLIAHSSWAEPCSDLWNGATFHEKQIARLLVEKYNLSGPTAPALGLILDAEISLKLEALAKLTGAVLSQERRAQLVEAALEKQKSAESATSAHRQNQRQAELDPSFLVEYYRKRVDPHSLFSLKRILQPHTDFSNQLLNSDGIGVQWTEDERFVLIRPNADQAKVIDLERGLPVDVDATKGYLTPAGFWVGQTERRETMLINLRTDEKWGPFDGIPALKYRNDSVVVTHSGGDLDDVQIYRKETGQFLEIFPGMVPDFDWTRIAYPKGNGFEVFDLDNWRHVATYQETSVLPHTGQVGFFIVRKKSGHVLVRLSDLKEWSLGVEVPDQVYAPDANHAVIRIPQSGGTDFSYQFMDLQTGDSRRFDQIETMSMDLSRRRFSLLLANNFNAETLLFDLSTMKESVLQGANFLLFSPDGEWVYRPNYMDEPKEAVKAWRFDGSDSLAVTVPTSIQFHPDSRHIFLLNRETRQTSWIYDGSQGGDNFWPIGDGEFGFSPSGNFFLSFEDGELVIRGRRVKK